jgi:hypothetical protein
MNWPISARRLVSAPLLSATLLLAATSCEKASDLGVELPGTSTTSTDYRDFPVTASTVLQDSLETLKATTYLVGRVQDNVLGTTAANAYFNLKLSPPTGDTLPSAVAGTTPMPQLDSLVLVMPFESVYGSAAAPFRANVYPLVGSLDEQALYNSSSSVAVDLANPLGTGVSARLNGSRVIRQRNDASDGSTDTTTFKVRLPDKTVRLKLNTSANTLASTIFSRLSDRATTFTQVQLDALLKGLSVQPTADFTSAVVGFPTTTAVTRAVFYYHYTNKKGTGTLKGSYSIPFGSQSAFNTKTNAPRYFTEIKTAPTGPFTRLQGADGSSQSVASDLSNDVVYTQAGSGFVTKLEIPGLKELKDLAQPQEGAGSAIAINRAELLVPIQPYTNLLFATPAEVYLYEANARNQPLRRVVQNTRVERLVLSDAVNQLNPILSGITGEGGYYRQAAKATPLVISDVNRSYGMLMTGYVQAYVYDRLSGPVPDAFLFSPALPSVGTLGLNRAVLDGKNIKLRVYYSRLR